jgi:mono/diheme cytochrome c family protein
MAISAVLASAAITVLPVAIQPAAAEDASNAFDGEWRYQTSCASCHGKNGEGISAFGPALKANTFVTQAPAAAIITVIQDGRYNRSKAYPDYSGMPSFYYIRAGEAEALVEYLKSL